MFLHKIHSFVLHFIITLIVLNLINCTPRQIIKKVPCNNRGEYSNIEIIAFECENVTISYSFCSNSGNLQFKKNKIPLHPIRKMRLVKSFAVRDSLIMYLDLKKGHIEFVLVSTQNALKEINLDRSAGREIKRWLVPFGNSLPKLFDKKFGNRGNEYFMVITNKKSETLYRHINRKWKKIGTCQKPQPIETKTIEFPFKINGAHSVPFKLFNVLANGPIKARIEWTGASTELSCELTGRRRYTISNPTIPYDKADGTSPLDLSYTVTNADLDRGVGWRLAIYDKTGNGDAEGTVKLTIPFDVDLDSQFQKEKIQLKSGDHWPSAHLHTKFVDSLNITPKDRLHGIITLSKPLTCKERWHSEQQGIISQSHLPKNHSFGYVRKGSNLSDPNLTGVYKNFTPLDPEDKINPHILLKNYSRFTIKRRLDPPINYVLDASGKITVSVLFARDVTSDRIEEIITASPCSFTAMSDHHWVGTCNHDDIVSLAEYDEVEWIDAGPTPLLETNSNTRPFIRVDDVQDPQRDGAGNLVLVGGMPNYNGLTGNGITGGICEGGGFDANHDDLNANLVSDDATRNGAHGTHVAGIFGGNGVRSDQNDNLGVPNNGTPFEYRGMAPEAGLIDTRYLRTASRLLDHIQNNSLDLSNHSHTFSTDGEYSADEQLIDQEIRGGTSSGGTRIPRRTFVGAAGNNGDDSPQHGYLRGYFSILNQAKNSLLLGSWNVTANQLSDFSSLGPWHAGRLKPDVVAPGSDILSTATNENEVQGIGFENGLPTAGNFTLSFMGNVTGNIPFNATAADVNAALVALPNIAAADVDVWFGPLPGNLIGVEFRGAFTNTNVPLMVSTDIGINGGANSFVFEDRAGAAEDGYTLKSGTSMASPAAAGVFALMLEEWQDTYSTPLGFTIDDHPPYPSTLRAIVIQTADDINIGNVRPNTCADIDLDNNQANGNDGSGFPTATVGPDYATGYGMVDALEAVELLRDHRIVNGLPVPNRIIQDAVSQNGVREYDFVVDAPGDLRVTLAWDDMEGAVQNPGTNPSLVNDLDLELIAPDNTIFYPWQLGHTITDINGNPIADNLQVPGTAIQVDVPRSPVNNPAANDEYVPANALNAAGDWVARQGRDHLNNVEQVFVNVPAAQVGHWIARVSGFKVDNSVQDYSLVGFPYPDLAELEVFCNDRVAIASFDDPMTFTWTVENNGDIATGAAFNYQVLLSRDFYIGDDVVLADDFQAPIAALPVGGVHNHQSRIRISQANANTLLGITGATVDDLLEDDVFILIHVDHDNTVWEHREINLAVAQLARIVDIVMVLDRSGSMKSEVPVSSGNQKKIDILKNSANLFADLMRLDANDRLAQVSFSSGITVDFGPTDALTEIGAGNIDDAKAAINALNASGSTNIRGALEQGLTLITDAGPNERRKVIIFFSDGKKTAGGDPSEDAFLQQFTDNDIHVYSVGFGTEGASGNAGIDIELLQLLANSNEHGFFHVTESSLVLDKFFVNAIAGAIDNDVIVDPVRTIAPGETHTLDVPITCQDYTSTFILTWDTPSENLNLSIQTPSGVTISNSNASLFGGHVAHISRSSYKLLKVYYPITTGVAEEQGGTWKMLISNSSGTPLKYSSSAISESSIHMTLDIPPSAPYSTYTPGATISLTIDLFQQGAVPITTSVVNITPNVPLISLGDFLASASISPAELSKVPIVIEGDTLTVEERLMIALQNKYEGAFPQLRADLPPVIAQIGEKGVLGLDFTNDSIEGYYQFNIVAEGMADCDPFRRESVEGVVIGTKIDEEATVIDLIPVEVVPGGGVAVTVTPVTTSGRYAGVGHSSSITIESDGALRPISAIRDNLDGSYSRKFKITTKTKGIVTVKYERETIGTVALDISIPTVNTVNPNSGLANEEQTLTISTDNRNVTPEGITGVVLVSPDARIQVQNFTVIPDKRIITAKIPAGIVPGRYSIILERQGQRGMSLAGVFYKVIATEKTLPKEVLSMQDNINQLLLSKSSIESINLLGKILHNIRKLPTGTSLTSKIKKETVDSIIGMMFKRTVTPDAKDILILKKTLEQSKIDACKGGR